MTTPQAAAPPGMSVLRDVLAGPDAGEHTAVALYTVQGAASASRACHGATALLPPGTANRSLTRAVERLPRFCEASALAPAELVDVAGVAGLTLRGAACAVAELPQAHRVALVAVRYAVTGGAAPADVAVALRLVLNDRPLPPCLADHERGYDFHQLTFVPPAVLAGIDDGSEPLGVRAERWVSVLKGGETWRPEHLVSRFPHDLNRFTDRLCAVTPGASVCGGADAALRLMLVLAATQSLGSLDALRTVNTRCYAALEDFRALAERVERAPHDETTRQRAARLEERARELRLLELDISLQVEAQQHVRLVLPLLPVEEFSAALGEALGLSGAIATTGRMIERIRLACEAEARAVEARRSAERTRYERRLTALSTMLAVLASLGLAITIVLAFLGANVKEVFPADEAGHYRSLWDVSSFAVPYALGVVLVGLVVVLSWIVIRRED